MTNNDEESPVVIAIKEKEEVGLGETIKETVTDVKIEKEPKKPP